MKGLLSSGIALLTTFTTSAGGFETPLNQPHDFLGGVSSEETDTVPFSRTADDFFATAPLVTIRFWMIATYPNLPEEFRFDVYEDAFGRPGDKIGSSFKASTFVEDLGPWNGQNDRHLLRVHFGGFDIFEPGVYWISPYGVGGGPGTRAWWGTSGNGKVNGSEGMFMSDSLGYPDWTGVSGEGLWGSPTDFAMFLGFLPSPGALPLLALGLIGARGRRWRG